MLVTSRDLSGSSYCSIRSHGHFLSSDLPQYNFSIYNTNKANKPYRGQNTYDRRVKIGALPHQLVVKNQTASNCKPLFYLYKYPIQINEGDQAKLGTTHGTLKEAAPVHFRDRLQIPFSSQKAKKITTGSPVDRPFQVENTLKINTPIPNELQIGLDDQEICAGDCIELEVTVANSTGNLAFDWSTGLSSTSNTITVCPDSSTDYQVIVSDDLTSDTATAHVTVNPYPDLELGPDTSLCIKTIILDPGDIADTYLWQDGSTSNTLEISHTGLYILEASSHNCTSTDSVFIDMGLPHTVATVLDHLDCATETVDITSLGSSIGPEMVYTWHGPAIISGQGTSYISVNEPGIYSLSISNTTNDCTDTKEVEVFENTDRPEGFILEISEPDCPGDLMEIEFLDVHGGTPPYFYSVDGGVHHGHEKIFSNLEAGHYTMWVADLNGCAFSEDHSLEDAPALVLSMDSVHTIDLGHTVMLNPYTNIEEEDMETVFWSPSETLSCTDCLHPIASPKETTLYELYIAKNGGCFVTERVLVVVKKDYKVFIPNVFTPRDFNGINDAFFVHGGEQTIEIISNMQIYDRWGNLVFTKQNLVANSASEGWDGQFEGRICPAGVYAYQIDIRFIDGTIMSYKGDVTILK